MIKKKLNILTSVFMTMFIHLFFFMIDKYKMKIGKLSRDALFSCFTFQESLGYDIIAVQFLVFICAFKRLSSNFK